MSRPLIHLILLITAVATMRAQMPPQDERLITLRLVDEGARPIEEKGGSYHLLDNKILRSIAASSRYVRYMLRLGDSLYDIERFPVDIRAELGNRRMVLRLGADVGTIPFRDGSFAVPRLYEPLFGLRPLNGSTILNAGIESFRVASIAQDPALPAILLGDIDPLTLDGTLLSADHYDPLGLNGGSGFHQVAGHPGTIYLTGRPTPSDIRVPSVEEERSGGMLYRSDDTGRTYRTVLPRSAPNPFSRYQKTLALFFAAPERGWAVTVNRMRHEERVVMRTDDGGTTWRIDSTMNRLGIVSGAFLDERRGWFAAAHREEVIRRYGEGEKGYHEIGNGWRVTLYRTDDGGATLTPAAVSDSSALIFVGYGDEPVVPLTPLNGRLCLVNLSGAACDLVSVGDSGARARRLPGGTIAARVDDTTAFLLHPSPERPGASPPPDGDLHRYDTLLRTTDGGRSWTPIMSLRDGGRGLAFPDAADGYLFGRNYLLRTPDGGDHWSYVAITRDPDDTTGRYRVEASYYYESYPFIITPIAGNRLRMSFPNGIRDVALPTHPFPSDEENGAARK